MTSTPLSVERMAELRERVLAFLKGKYVIRADARQKELGLSYVEAETNNLAKEIAVFIASSPTLPDVAGAGEQELRKALEPFAAYADKVDSHYSSQGYPDACPATLNPEADGTKEIVNLGHFRRAREILSHPLKARKEERVEAREILMAMVGIDDDHITEILAQALTSAHLSGVREEWQPIETLHRIDTQIVLWNPCDGIHLLNVATTSLRDLDRIRAMNVFTYWRRIQAPALSGRSLPLPPAGETT